MEFDFAVIYRSRSIKGHHLTKFDRARAINAANQVTWSLAIQFLGRKFSKVFTIYGCGGHLGHVTFLLLPYSGSTCNWISIGLEISEEMTFERS